MKIGAVWSRKKEVQQRPNLCHIPKRGLKLRNKDIKHAKVEHEDGVMGHLAYDYVKD